MLASPIAQLLNWFLQSHSVCTDSRKVKAGDLFFALKGENFNGNEFIQHALNAGCIGVVGDEPRSNDPRFILVDNTLHALQELGLAYRKKLGIPVLALTGSNGKTSTKELIRDVLGTQYRVHATKGNFNNHIGIPLTLLSCPENAEWMVVEMGANHQREIAAYCEYVEPNFGLITNIGKAHLEGFGGIVGVQKGKGELFEYLFDHQGIVFCNHKLPHLQELVNGHEYVDYSAAQPDENLHVSIAERGLKVEWNKEDKTIQFDVHMTGEYNKYNIATALVIADYLGLDVDKVIQAISNYVPDNMRSQWYQGKSNRLILDAYNANPTSMENALQNLGKLEHANRWAIIGEMREMGDFSFEEHRSLVRQTKSLPIQVIFVGKEFIPHLDPSDLFFPTAQSCKEWLKQNPIEDAIILIKGSRGIGLEIVKDEL
jgi:UDP-N-acetylmuramoyl-tripeptide--D-alanyl-D-alanine ligase